MSLVYRAGRKKSVCETTCFLFLPKKANAGLQVRRGTDYNGREGGGKMQWEKELALLKSGILFRNLTDEEIARVTGALRAHAVQYAKRGVVAGDGDALRELGVVLEGRLHLEHADADGNNNLMGVLGPGDVLGAANAVGGYRLHWRVTAVQPSRILFLNVDGLLRKNVLTDPAQVRFVQNLTLLLAQRVHGLTQKIEDSTRRSTRDRLQDYLSAEYHKARARTFVIPLNRQQLADFLFVDRSAMSSELCRMRDEGLVRFDKSRFELLVEMPITDDEPDPNENE